MTVPPDVHDVAVVEQPIDEGGSYDLVERGPTFVVAAY